MVLGSERMPLNQQIGKKFTLKYLNKIVCCNCGKETKKSYGEGHCFPCTQKLAACDICIVKPELCHFDKGTCREPEWGKQHCMIPHYVYLSNTSGLKVGITRHNQIPTRWIDQGAIQGLPIFKVDSRHHSGLIEEVLATLVTDKTNWRNMLKGEIESLDLQAERDRLMDMAGEQIESLEEELGLEAFDYLENETVIEIKFPVLEFPKKIVSLSFDKENTIEGTLLGIKGQYLIFDTGVLNIRRHSSYLVEAQA
ncbi:MAG: DUF2797 domain-containing protein [Bdellovibrio sp.]